MEPRITLRRLFVFACVTLGVACALPSEASPPTDLIERHVAPSATNPRIVAFDEDDVVWLVKDGSKRIPTLMVMLAGTNGQPSNATLIGATSARQGYHVIGLMYPDDVAVQSVCPTDPDPGCAADLRLEVITGENVSPYVTVDFDNSIDGRLTALLEYLMQRYPDENWQQFLDQDRPRWSKIAVAGLSQGGGHAAFIGKLRSVQRVVMFGAPADGTNGAAAPWMSIGATPAPRYYGFKHELDPFTSIISNWHALGIDAFGQPVNIDGGLPSAGTHLFLTNVPSTSALNAHASVYADGGTPMKNGIPVFLAAWKYLLGP